MTGISTMSRNEDVFSIEVESPASSTEAIDSTHHTIGKITVGSFSETFTMPIGYWTVRDYRDSWCRAIARLMSDQNAKSCLMASMTDPETTNFLFCWPLYRLEQIVYVQNSIIFLGEDHPFDPGQPWLSVWDRQTVDDDGNSISEWQTSISAISAFSAKNC